MLISEMQSTLGSVHKFQKATLKTRKKMSITASHTVTKSSFDAQGQERGFFDSTTSNSFMGSYQANLNSQMENTARGNFDVGELIVKK